MKYRVSFTQNSAVSITETVEATGKAEAFAYVVDKYDLNTEGGVAFSIFPVEEEETEPFWPELIEQVHQSGPVTLKVKGKKS